MGVTVSWSEGITSMSKQQRRYRYFDLVDPPEDMGKEDYETTQYIIAKEIQSIKQEINKSKNDRMEMIKKDLLEKKTDSLSSEAILYKSLKGKGEYSDLTSKQKITFWTDYYILPHNKEDKNKWTEKDCFALLIRSTLCYMIAKSESQEIFSRTKLLDKELPSTINNKLLNDIMKQLTQSIGNLTIKQTEEIILQIQTDLTNIFQKGSAVSRAKKVVSKGGAYGAATFSKNLREELREYIDKNKLWSVFGDEPGVFKLTNNNDTVFLQVLDSQKRENIFSKYQDASKIEKLLQGNEKEQQQGLSRLSLAVQLSFLDIISQMKKESIPLTLDLKMFGKINLNTQQEAEMFFNKAREYVKKDLMIFLKQKQGKDIIIKTFKATRSNAFVSGLLGELAAAIQFSKQNIAKMTGNVYGEIAGSSFGGSVNDITTSQNGINYGVNIKHYITKDDNITLYNSQKNELGINSSYLSKYYTEEEIVTMRWAIENQAFLTQRYGDKNFAKDVAYYYSWKEIPTFLRIEDYTENSVKNLFFQLNNVIYPTSIIYDAIIEQLETGLLNKIANKNAEHNPFFSISQSVKNIVPIMYDTRNDALFANPIESIYEKNYFIDGKVKNGNLKIKTNGLNINLERLNLLMR